jgi:hypothetical protein
MEGEGPLYLAFCFRTKDNESHDQNEDGGTKKVVEFTETDFKRSNPEKCTTTTMMMMMMIFEVLAVVFL